jgi:hypothetical protein
MGQLMKAEIERCTFNQFKHLFQAFLFFNELLLMDRDILKKAFMPAVKN